MGNNRDSYSELWQGFREAETVRQIVSDLESLDELAENGKLSVSDAYGLRFNAFDALRELTARNPVEAKHLILDSLLPFCVLPPVQIPEDARYEFSKYLDVLRDWVEQYEEAERSNLRDSVLDALVLHLGDAEPQSTCWAIGRIGFRRDDVVETLWNVVDRHDNPTGDCALSVLASLGVPGQERERVLAEAHSRVPKRQTLGLLSALRILADRSSIPLVRESWLVPSDDGSWGHFRSSALRVLLNVANRHSTESELQDQVWDVIASLFDSYPAFLTPDIYLGSDVVPRCNTRLVVPSMLEWLTKVKRDSGRAERFRYLLCLRLGECERPRQLDGWAQPPSSEALEQLQADACQDTGRDGLVATDATHPKEIAWDTPLRLGRAAALGCFDGAVAGETSSFVRKNVMERLACFRIDPLPATAVAWITEPYDMKGDGSSHGWAFRLGAVRLAWSAGSRQAFNALCRSGVTIEGKVLKKSVDALYQVALALANKDDAAVIEDLLGVAGHGAEKWHRTTAALAIEYLAAARVVAPKHASVLAALAEDEDRESYERGALVAALGHLPVGSLALETVARLRCWAMEDDDQLGWNSLEALARQGLLHEDVELLRDRLGLEWNEHTWDLHANGQRSERTPVVLGILYHQQPAAFVTAVAKAIVAWQWREVVPLLYSLRVASAAIDKAGVPEEIQRALVTRAREKQTRSSAEMAIFGDLAHLIPQALAREPWNELWDNWLPDARVALADSLGEAPLEEPASVRSATSQLLMLTRHAQYAIRRAAFRALSRRSPDLLLATCVAWSESPSEDLRRRAGEGSGWIGDSEEASERLSALVEILSNDRERRVREATQRSWEERRSRIWARHYLQKVCLVNSERNDEILTHWRYGEALKRLGDDECIQLLREHLR